MADPANLPPLPKDHLSHPENWVTGDAPATDKQQAFVKSLQSQHPDAVPEGGLDVENLGKSEASEVIEKLKSGETVGEGSEGKRGRSGEEVEKGRVEDDKDGVEGQNEKAKAETTKPSKRKSDAVDLSNQDASDNDNKHGSSSKPPTLKHPKGTKQARLDPGGFVDDPPPQKLRPESTDADDDRQAVKGEGAEDTKDEVPNGTDGTNGDEAKHERPEVETGPGDEAHLDHPENWATGAQPATDKQKGFIRVLEKQKGSTHGSVDSMGKSEASERIEELKSM